MFDKLPACMEKANKGQKIDQVLAIIQENAHVSFADLRRLVCERLGVSTSTAYDYLRRAREVVNQQVAVARSKGRSHPDQISHGEELETSIGPSIGTDHSQMEATETPGRIG